MWIRISELTNRLKKIEEVQNAFLTASIKGDMFDCSKPVSIHIIAGKIGVDEVELKMRIKNELNKTIGKSNLITIEFMNKMNQTERKQIVYNSRCITV